MMIIKILLTRLRHVRRHVRRKASKTRKYLGKRITMPTVLVDLLLDMNFAFGHFIELSLGKHVSLGSLCAVL